MNRNKACPSASKSPELLAKYSDGLLRKSNKSGGEEADLEQSLADTVSTPLQSLFPLSFVFPLTPMPLLAGCRTDDRLQVHRRQGRFPEVLFEDARKAFDQSVFRIRRCRGFDDIQIEGCLWVRVHKQVAENVPGYGLVQGFERSV